MAPATTGAAIANEVAASLRGGMPPQAGPHDRRCQSTFDHGASDDVD